MKQILIIQTAFIGDVILATALVEKMIKFYPNAKIDFLLRKGNESLLDNNPHLRTVLIWDKTSKKVKNLRNLLKQIKSVKYDIVLSAHRYASSGYLVAYSGATHRVGFKNNPFSFKFTHKPIHEMGKNKHEIDRNQQLIAPFTDDKPANPKLYPSALDESKVAVYQKGDYVCMAPASVWFTKQLPKQQWLKLIQQYKNSNITIYLLGGANDALHNDYIMASSFQNNVVNLAGELNFLESSALMKKAIMNYVNDSGPLHMTSAVNAPVTAFFCSTVPEYGFGPLSDHSKIVQSEKLLSCKPCGLHGHKACPKKHFDCGHLIDAENLA